jgi:hypothetical protein
MANELYIYSTPAASAVTLTLDGGVTITGTPCTVHGRSDAHLCQLPPGTLAQGGLLKVGCDGYRGITHRGIVVPNAEGEAWFQLDDVHLEKIEEEPVPPEPPPLDPNLDPFALIRSVYEQGEYDLSTKEGCGVYTEACCTALHEQQSQWWGHIRKNPGQNQWVGPSGVGHAIDAIQLVAQAGSTGPGIYDIILSTESPDAEPAWSYKGAPDHALWYYPA